LTVFFIVPGIVSMGIGFGAAYPDFKSENAAQTVTSFGGVIFMMLCAGYIGAVIMLEAGPVYHILMAGIRNESLGLYQWAWTISSFSLAFAVCILAFLLPMRFGERRLSELLL
jgi:ABC-2 type transport system permease protein